MPHSDNKTGSTKNDTRAHQSSGSTNSRPFAPAAEPSQARKLLTGIFNNIGTCIWITDVLGEDDFVWTYNNPADQKLTGFDLNKPGGVRFEELMDKQAAEFNRKQCRKVMRTGKPATFEDKFTHQGKTRWSLNTLIPISDEEGKITHIAGTGVDITERKKNTEALRQSKETLEEQVESRTVELKRINETLKHEIGERKKTERTLRDSELRYRVQFQNSLAVKLIIDPADGSLVDANHAACTFYGYNRHQLLEKKIWDFNILDQKEVKSRMLDASWMQQNHFYFKHRLANGDIRDVEVYSSPIPVDDKTYLYSIIHDITEKVEAEKRAAEKQKELEHAGRLISIGEMTSGLAHEINQPLCAVLAHAEGCLSLLKKKTPDTEKLTEKIKTIINQSEHAGRVINNIKGFVKKSGTKASVISVDDVINETLDFFATDLRHNNITLEQELAGGKVNADHSELQQVLMNLIKNSIDSLSGIKNRKPELTVKSFSDEKNVIINISDNGEGLDIKAEGRLFEPFYTTKKQGLGLGLSISASIMEKYGGKLKADNNRSNGATFQCIIPAAH